MKKQLFIMAILAMGMSLASCSSDDDENNDNGGEVNAALADYTATNAKQWGNYMLAVSTRLQNDATTLYNDWAESYNGGKSYAEIFKAHNGTEGYNSALQCVQTIIEFCGVIANEVGTAKIGDPYNEYVNG
ncbi:MAG: peptidase M75, partial [Prevotella sp.]|nr:peptidase M75 [Prevotella sp.]